MVAVVLVVVSLRWGFYKWLSFYGGGCVGGCPSTLVVV